MMKRIIQVCSMLALTVVFFAVAANAQTANRINAKIPFDFKVGEKTYAAGDYVINISRVSVSSTAVSLEDGKGNVLQNFIAFSSGESAAADGAARLVFDSHNAQRYLSRIITKDKGLTLASLNNGAVAKNALLAAR